MNNPKYSANNTAKSTQRLTINNLKNLTNIHAVLHYKIKNKATFQRVKRNDCRDITPTRFLKDGIAGRDKQRLATETTTSIKLNSKLQTSYSNPRVNSNKIFKIKQAVMFKWRMIMAIFDNK